MNNDIKTISASVNYAKPAIWHPVIDFLLVIAVNIHHYFVDGEIWKLSNLEMQRTLLAHFRER